MLAAKKTKPPEALGELEPMLTRLKLTAIRDQLDTLLDQAGRAELNLREALAMLCAAEVVPKDERRIQIGMLIANFLCLHTPEGFEYDAQPSVDPKQIRELATSRWVANGDSLLLLGPPRRGQDAPGGDARPRGDRARLLDVVRAGDLAGHAARSSACRGPAWEKLLHFTTPKLLVVDELGYLSYEANAAHLFFELVSRRCERGSMLVTSNRSVAEWGGVFGDAVVATAILERLAPQPRHHVPR